MTEQELLNLADALRANTVKLRFFRGQTYDGFADEYLRQLTVFIDAVGTIMAISEKRERERCATVALEQRCAPGTHWDLACTTIADKIRASARLNIQADQQTGQTDAERT